MTETLFLAVLPLAITLVIYRLCTKLTKKPAGFFIFVLGKKNHFSFMSMITFTFFVFGLILPVFFHVDKTVFLGYHINLQTICAIGPKKDAKDAKRHQRQPV